MKTLEATVSAWGKSTAIRIPTALVKHSGIYVGQTVKIQCSADGVITIRAVRERPTLATLLERVTLENLPDEADISWGDPAGSEAW